MEETGSGARNDRPGLQRLMDAVRRGRLDVVLVWKLDRFGRSALDVLANIRDLDAASVRFVATTQGIDIRPGGDAMSRLILGVLPSVAEFERDLIRERQIHSCRMTTRCESRDLWVETPRGRLFVRTWSPGGDAARPRDRAPIVLLHDSLGSVELWRGFPERLCAATGRRVVAYDRLGFGRSDARHGPLAADFVREEAETWFPLVRQGLGIGEFIAMGHSVGGGMAALCAATWPEACLALVTESAQAFVEDRTLEGIRAAQNVFRDAGQLDRLAKYHGEKARWVLNAWIEVWFSPGFRPWSLARDLPRITCPTLVIHGDEDEYGSVVHPRRIGSLVGGESAVEILPGCRHVPHREAEEVVVERIARFLDVLGEDRDGS